jgi:hypothetical protein
MAETLRDGRFVILGRLGRGSQGETFDAIDKREGRAVAIKRFDVGGAQSWKDVELAEREARVLQSLSHPKLPGYIDHFESDGALYLVMEKIDGESLAGLHARGVVLSEQDVVRLLTDASEVLDYLHRRVPPVIHRDLKPGNVIRRPDGSFAFVDFGAVRDKLRIRGGSTIVGTFGYMAPEQFQGRALPASDVYAIGATAVAMLTGREPEDLPHRGLAMDVHSALQGLARPPLVDVLERMLAPDPETRADRIAPLLLWLAPGRGRSRPETARRGGDAWELAGHQHWERAVRVEVQKAEHRARRHAQRQMQRAMRAEWRRGAHPIPRPVGFVLAISFAVAMLAVTLSTQVVGPLVLRLLGLFIAPRALKNAAVSVRNAGTAALASIAHEQRALWGAADTTRHGDSSAPGPAQAPAGPTRVATPPETPSVPREDPLTPAESTEETLEPRSASAKH